MRHVHYVWLKPFLSHSKCDIAPGKLARQFLSLRRKSWASLALKKNKWISLLEKFSSSYDVSKMASSLMFLRSAGQNGVSYVCRILSSSSCKIKASNFTECNANKGGRREKALMIFDLNRLIYLLKQRWKTVIKLNKDITLKHSETISFSNVNNFTNQSDGQLEEAFSEFIAANDHHPVPSLQKRPEEAGEPPHGEVSSSKVNPSKFASFDWKQSECQRNWRFYNLKHLFNQVSLQKKSSPSVQKNDSGTAFSSIDDFVKHPGDHLEKAFSELMSTSAHPPDPTSSQNKKNTAKIEKPSGKASNQIISKASIENRSKFMVKSLVSAVSKESQLLRLQEICKHLHLFPHEKNTLIKEGALRVVLQLRERSKESAIWDHTREALALLGFIDPPLGRGVRILSIDGGGTRGLMAVEILKQLETRTGKRIHELFDFVCGVSTGAILTLLLCGVRLPLDECEALYKELSKEIFSQSAWWGTGKLVWSHAYYDTNVWVNKLKQAFNEKLLTESARHVNNPKFAVVSTVMNQPALQAYVFRNYNLPFRVQSPYLGSCSHKMWEAVRASGAAPGYFEEFCLDDIVHQDGGLMINNPTALAIHEVKMLWPDESIQCVMSLGSGRYVPPPQTIHTSTSLKTKLLKVIDSATDTEAVHIMLNDLLPPNTYFRLNPYLTELLALDEHRSEKLQQLKIDAQMYLRRNEHKLSHAIAALIKHRGHFQHTKDWIQLQKKIKW